MGLLAGIYVALSVAGWMGEHWHGAQPAGLYLVLRWVVAVLVGLALATAFRWWGNSMAKAVRDGPLSWLDRSGGMLLGTVVGATVCTFGLLGALQFEHPKGPGMIVAQARVGAPTMGVAAAICGFGEALFPGCRWWREQFLVAQRRALRMREHGISAATD